MFRMMLLSAWTVLYAYVFWRAATLPVAAKRLSWPGRLIAGTATWAVFFFLTRHGREGQGILASRLETVGMSWIAFLFLTATILLAVDLATGFGFLLPRLAPRLRAWAFIAGALLSAFALVQGMRPPVIRDYEVRLAGLPRELDGTVVAAFSDLHLGPTLNGKWLRARVDQVLEIRPDLVILLGDLFEGHGRPAGGLAGELRRLQAPLGTWAIMGNHESHGNESWALDLLTGVGIRVLRDEWVEAAPGLALAGVDDHTSQYRLDPKVNFMAPTLAGHPSGAAILLSHFPLQASEAAAAGAGLMLSGHTHGGQIWPFGYLVRLMYPFVAGRYEVDGMPVIVTRGAGTWGPRMRLWRPAEILRITLHS